MMLADLVAHGRGFVKSCKTLGFTSQSAYAELKRDPSFRALIDAARVAAKEGIEESLYERACRSDTTAGIFLLKAMDPDRYSERMRVEGVHRVEINVSLIPAEEALDATGVEAEVVDAEYSEDSL